MNVISTIVGYPYIGPKREWKRKLESYWKKELTENEFEAALKQLRIDRLKHQQNLGLEYITVGDFTKYDRMLDLAVMFNLIPKRYEVLENTTNNELYYAMARGAKEVVACEMTKWFNTNYHYIVPEYKGQKLSLQGNSILDQFLEARDEVGINAKPTIIGPYTFVDLAKGYNEKEIALFILQLIPLYAQVFNELTEAGAEWIQIEEPSFTKNLPIEEIQLIKEIYKQLREQVPNAKLMVQTYFESLHAYEQLIQLPVDGFGLDFAHGGKQNLKSIQEFGFPKDKALSIGVINGRDIWSVNLAEAVITINTVKQLTNVEDLWISSSCSLQHIPVSKNSEEKLPLELFDHLAFADEKIREIANITYFIQKGSWLKKGLVANSMKVIEALATHPIRKNVRVEKALDALESKDFKRCMSFKERQQIQKEALKLPDFPTTTIGSFPQSAEVKKTRSAWRKGDITDAQYAQFVKEETARWVHIQEEIGLDVLVHGEFERTDMVEYFGEHLTGFAFTDFAWVVSYGSRCVKPPIIYGDVEWIYPMTVKEVVAAQELTDKFVKGMLTGPVTILNWSFVRNDIKREKVALQIGYALRQELSALETAGIKIIQVDEPALREGLPLRKENWNDYLRWAVDAFKLTTSDVAPDTQIHTHMCYCEFNDFIEPIRALDADVISLETSRSHGELILSLKEHPYELGIGLGVYDIHSPRVPSKEEIRAILQESLAVIPKEQFWINPDCGLKTRHESETVASLKNMVAAAQKLRKQTLSI
jgi:5-methyltetrahydropteroyltriglutamate--homocysteine methyltransferase